MMRWKASLPALAAGVAIALGACGEDDVEREAKDQIDQAEDEGRKALKEGGKALDDAKEEGGKALDKAEDAVP